MVLPSDAGDISPLHCEKEFLFLEGEDPHLSVRPGGFVVVSHAVDAVALQQKKRGRKTIIRIMEYTS